MQETVTQDRDKYLGGSDIPAVMGISPFKTRWQLLQQKAGYEEDKFKGSVYTEYGNEMEPVIRDYINEHWGMNFVEDKIILEDSDVLPTRYHSDGHDKEQRATLEIKTTSQIARIFDAIDKNISFDDYEWEFYKKYYVQAFFGADAFKDDWVWLAVYERPDDMSEEFDPSRLFISTHKVIEHTDFLAEIQTEVAEFRNDYNYILQNPWVEEAQLPSRNALAGIANDYFEIGGTQIPAAWLLQNEKALTDAVKEVKTQLLMQMQEHKIKTCSFDDLGLTATVVAQGADKVVQKFDEKAFAKDNPELHEKYLKDTVQKGKASYVRVTPMA